VQFQGGDTADTAAADTAAANNGSTAAKATYISSLDEQHPLSAVERSAIEQLNLVKVREEEEEQEEEEEEDAMLLLLSCLYSSRPF
jgi:hypothetical protein